MTSERFHLQANSIVIVIGSLQQEEERERVRDTERFLQQQKQQFTAAAAAAANQYEQERAFQQPQVRHDVIERRPRSPAEVERRLPAHDSVPSQKAESVESKPSVLVTHTNDNTSEPRDVHRSRSPSKEASPRPPSPTHYTQQNKVCI